MSLEEFVVTLLYHGNMKHFEKACYRIGLIGQKELDKFLNEFYAQLDFNVSL